MELDWIEMIGFAGTGFTILAYGARQLVPLRILGIGSSLAFLAYGLLTHSYPLVIMEAVLLPINSWRLAELLAARQKPSVRLDTPPGKIAET